MKFSISLLFRLVFKNVDIIAGFMYCMVRKLKNVVVAVPAASMQFGNCDFLVDFIRLRNGDFGIIYINCQKRRVLGASIVR